MCSSNECGRLGSSTWPRGVVSAPRVGRGSIRFADPFSAICLCYSAAHPNLAAVAMHYPELIVRTQYDGRDLMAVSEVVFYDEDGDEQVCHRATDECIDIHTCADQGGDLWSWLRQQVEGRLHGVGITYDELTFEDSRGD